MKLKIIGFLLLAFMVLLAFFLSQKSPILFRLNIESKNSLKTKPVTKLTEQKAENQPTSDTPYDVTEWLSQEAALMDTKSYDSLLEEGLLQEKALKLTALEIDKLKTKALAVNATANERILSVYMLTQSSSLSFSALQEIASAKLSVEGVPAPHSLDETQSMHEKAILRMSLDELFNRAINDPGLVSELAKTIENLKIPELKAYAKKRFQQLFP